eukprot:Hpha_TRINITY_DN22548_c0_g1::TRINITY_DN22548_c0_g1_i1::g.185080::m.185080
MGEGVPVEWWAAERDEFYADSHGWSLRSGATVERFTARVVEAGTRGQGGWSWGVVGDSHGSAPLCYRSKAHARVLKPGAVVTLTGRALTDKDGRTFICLPPGEEGACVASTEADSLVIVPSLAQVPPTRPRQRVGCIMVQGGRLALTREGGRCRVPAGVSVGEETPEATAARVGGSCAGVGPAALRLLPHLGNVMHAEDGVVEHWYLATCTEGTGGAGGGARWVTLGSALRLLHTHAERSALGDAAQRLKQAVAAGVVDTQAVLSEEAGPFDSECTLGNELQDVARAMERIAEHDSRPTPA